MSACTFFGHRECYGLDAAALENAILKLIHQGIDTFYVGNQGSFDRLCYHCLKQLRKSYPNIQICVVLAYLPTKSADDADLEDAIYPEIEGYPKFAIERRNRWMIDQSDYCICYINHTWGGAYKFVRIAKNQGLQILNLGSAAENI